MRYEIGIDEKSEIRYFDVVRMWIKKEVICLETERIITSYSCIKFFFNYYVQ